MKHHLRLIVPALILAALVATVLPAQTAGGAEGAEEGARQNTTEPGDSGRENRSGSGGRALPLTPSQAVKRAVAASRGVDNARLELAIQQDAADNSWNRFLPSLQFSAGPSYSFAEELENRWSASGQLSARLTLSGSTFTLPEGRDLAVRESTLALDRQEWRLRREVLRGYFDIVSRRASVELQEQRVTAARRRLAQSEENFERGVVSEFSVLEARLSYQNALPELSAAEQRLRAAIREFRSLLAVPEAREIELVSDIPKLALETSPEELLSEYAGGAPALREAQLARAAAALESAREENALLPSVSLSASLGYTGAEPFELSDQGIRRTGSGNLTVTVPIDPFVPGSDGSLGREESRRRITIAENRFDSAEDELSRAVRNALDSVTASAEQINVVERNADLAERVYRIAQERFEAGAISSLELQNSELERTRSQVAVIEQRLVHVRSLIEVEFLLGANLEELPWE